MDVRPMTSKSLVIRQDDPHTRILKVCSMLAIPHSWQDAEAIANLRALGDLSWAAAP